MKSKQNATGNKQETTNKLQVHNTTTSSKQNATGDKQQTTNFLRIVNRWKPT
jgi:hypothetical protein